MSITSLCLSVTLLSEVHLELFYVCMGSYSGFSFTKTPVSPFCLSLLPFFVRIFFTLPLGLNSSIPLIFPFFRFPLTHLHYVIPFPTSSPFCLITEGADEDGEGVDLRVRCEDPGESLRPDAVAFQVCVAQNHHEVLVGLVPRQLLDAGLGGLQGVITAHAELSVGMHGLQGEADGTDNKLAVA